MLPVRRETLLDFFNDLVTLQGDFLVYDDGYRRRAHTYSDVGRAARGFAARLAGRGLRKGDKVLVWGENRPEWIVCYWGCLLLGVVVVPIDYRSSPAFASRVRGVVDASVVMVGDEVQPFGDAFAGAEIWRLAELDWNADGPVPQVEITRDDLTQIIFTSGATAEPKGVVIRHRNVLANVVPVEREVLKYRAYARPFLPLRFVNLLPLSHMFGQSMATNIPPMVRGTVIFTRSLNPHDVIDLIRSRRVSVPGLRPQDPGRPARPRAPAHAGGRSRPAGRHLHPGPLVAVPEGSPGLWRQNSGHLSSGRPPCPPTWRSSGGGWGLRSSRATV